MVTVRYTPGVTIRLDGPAEQVRRNHDQRIAELAAAAQLTPRGAYLGRQVLTGVGTYTPTAGTTAVTVRMVGGGGGGGGAGGGGAGLGLAAGGNSGFQIEFSSSSSSRLSGGAFAGGAGGAGGANTPADGSTGGDSTLVVNGVTYTAKGGTGGTKATIAANGAAWPLLPATQDVTRLDAVTYGIGGTGFWFGSVDGMNGAGGAVPLSRGGAPFFGGGPGLAGLTGGGGAGARASTGTSAAGGAGGNGLIVIDEYA